MTLSLEPPIQHLSTDPIIIVGAQGSGQRWLAHLLHRHLRVSFAPPSRFILRLARMLPRYGDLGDDGNLWRLVDAVARERDLEQWMLTFGFVLDRARVFSRAAAEGRSYAAVLRATFEQLARYQGTTRWGHDGSEYIDDLPLLSGLFPSARFVHLVRDGRDAALSTSAARRRSLLRNAMDWRHSVRAIGEFTRSRAPQRVHLLHYEALHTTPGETLRRLTRFLGIDHPQALGRMSAEIEVQRSAIGVDGWPARMSHRQQRLFEGLAGDQLGALGYATSHRAGSRLNIAERIYRRTDDLLRHRFKAGRRVSG